MPSQSAQSTPERSFVVSFCSHPVMRSKRFLSSSDAG
jgi:hypothetical protein